MDELRTLVEEGRVVFVGFNDEIRARAKPARSPEPRRHSPHEPAGISSRALEDPRNETCDGGLAVGTRDRDHVPAVEGVRGEP